MSFVKVTPPFDIKTSFWDNNYQIALIEPFKKLYDRDKSKDKSVSSMELWCIWLHQDPSSDNKIGKLPQDQKLDSIRVYYSEFDPEDKLIKECLEMYDMYCLTPAGKAFKEEEASLIKRAKFMAEKEYTFDEFATDRTGAVIYSGRVPLINKGTATELDRMRANTLKIYQQYSEVRKMFMDEESNVRIWGGGTEGLLDEGNLIDFEDE